MSSESELVVDLCARRPMALRVLARHHIDTATAACPKRTLAACCQDVGLEPGAILAELDTAEAQLVAPWNDRPLSALIDHVLCTYHRPFAGELDDVVCEIDELARVSVSTVASTWRELRHHVDELRVDMEQHMAKEERVLFPWLRGRADTAAVPIRAMQLEHADTMGILQAVHEVAARVAGAAASPALAHVERTLCEHIHLENNVLFPRALEVMSSRR